MAELFKGQPGSPITYLVSDISAGQTTISIADNDALPDAPNICTIGYGEHIETIRYGAKSNGVLQQVTRGIEGTPRAWQAGTEIARFFTAYDHNTIIENFMTHQAESAKKHITESGTNENGSYIRFDDGTQICTTVVSFDATSTALQSYVSPAIFNTNSPKTVFFSVEHLSATAVMNDMPNIAASMRHIIKRTFHLRSSVPGNNDDLEICVTIIGRWKDD